VGCGTGLFARHLAGEWGVPVFAVDASASMLAAARRQCAGLNVQFLRQDLRCLALPSRVDLITAHFDTLNHLTGCGDLAQAMRSVAANLTPRGWFYFDLVTPCAPLGGYDAVLRRALLKRSGEPTRYFEQRAVWLPQRRLIAVRARVATRNPCSIAVAEDRHLERAYGATELGDAVAAAGLIVRGVYDEATLRHAGRCPPRLVVVAQKPG
jgi:SAM-dependent methyltransferase